MMALLALPVAREMQSEIARCERELAEGAVAGVVGIESSVVSGVFNLESSGVGTPDRRPRHDKSYHEG